MNSRKEKSQSPIANTPEIVKPITPSDPILDSFAHLKRPQAIQIIEIIQYEVTRSKGFNLDIPGPLIAKEQLFFLTFFNMSGGIEKLTTSTTFEQTLLLVGLYANEIFSEEQKQFATAFTGARDGHSPNRYSAHLKTTIESLVHAVYVKTPLNV